jgi:hypothetical protein
MPEREPRPARRIFFSEQQAQELQGTRIRTRVPFSGVPAGTEGTIIAADQLPAGHTVAVVWDLPHRPFGAEQRPLVDWFSKREYRQFLVKVEREEGFT